MDRAEQFFSAVTSYSDWAGSFWQILHSMHSDQTTGN